MERVSTSANSLYQNLCSARLDPAASQVTPTHSPASANTSWLDPVPPWGYKPFLVLVLASPWMGYCSDAQEASYFLSRLVSCLTEGSELFLSKWGAQVFRKEEWDSSASPKHSGELKIWYFQFTATDVPLAIHRVPLLLNQGLNFDKTVLPWEVTLLWKSICLIIKPWAWPSAFCVLWLQETSLLYVAREAHWHSQVVLDW